MLAEEIVATTRRSSRQPARPAEVADSPYLSMFYRCDCLAPSCSVHADSSTDRQPETHVINHPGVPTPKTVCSNISGVSEGSS